MPYIHQSTREKFAPVMNALPFIGNPGELNYLFTRIALAYIGQHGVKYQRLNDVSGALTNCNLELYRRLAGPYEDSKISENGDVFDVF
jgi:hypothetical protein